MSENNFNRRDFLRGATLGAFGAGFGLEEITAEAQAKKPAAKPAAKPATKPAQKTQPAPAPPPKISGPPVPIAVIGIGERGREILASLARVGPAAPVAYICDTFADPKFVKRGQAIAPKAVFVQDYKKILDDKNVKAVFVATPSHKHKQIVLDALQAGKHVYCEAPLSNDIAEAKEIALAGKGATSIVFQSGLQQRCNLQSLHVGKFVQTNQLGPVIEARAQWHNKTSWKTAWPTNQREEELNWRLKRATSSGLLGEIGIHQLDLTSWFLKRLPVSVTAFSAQKLWLDRDVPDTVQVVLEYPASRRLIYDITLTNSFDGAYELFMAQDGSLILRDQRAWMFKEADSSQLGWEVFARKDQWVIGDPSAGSGLALGTGIALVADATKQLALGKKPGEMGTDLTRTAIYQAVETFIRSCQAGQRVSVKEKSDADPNPAVAPGPEEGYTATVVAIKCNEAALANGKITFEKDWFTL